MSRLFLALHVFLYIQNICPSENGDLSFSFWQPQNQQTTPSCKHHMQPLSHQPQFQPVHQTHHQSINQSPHAVHYSQNHQCGATSHLPEIAHAHHSPTMSQHMVCLQPLTGGHVGGRLHVLVSSISHAVFLIHLHLLMFSLCLE